MFFVFANQRQPFEMKTFVTESENSLIKQTLRNETFGILLSFCPPFSLSSDPTRFRIRHENVRVTLDKCFPVVAKGAYCAFENCSHFLAIVVSVYLLATEKE